MDRRYIIPHFLSPSARRVWVEIGYGSVDKNDGKTSPSARRVWVEIPETGSNGVRSYVTLREEGVG